MINREFFSKSAFKPGGLILFIISFLSGIAVAIILPNTVNYASIVFLCGFAFLAIGFLRKNNLHILFFIFLIALAFGLWRVGISVENTPSDLKVKVGETVSFDAVLVDEADERETNLRLTAFWSEFNEKVLVVAPLEIKPQYGDVISISGKLTQPKNFLTDTGREFDYVNYLKVRDINFVVTDAQIEIIQPGSWFSLWRILYFVKGSFIKNLELVLPEPHSSLAAGLVFGAKQGLGQRWQDIFRETGIIHIVVLSGYNITIIAESILKSSAFFLSRTLAVGVGAGSIVLFAMMVGGGATVVRASIMALIALLARATGRTYDLTIALLIAAFLMVLHNPLILVHDVGFQLSFLATVGLIYGSPIIEKYLTKVPKFLGLKEIVSSTLSAQVAVLPWLLYVTGEVSLVSPIVNLLVLPAVPITMLFAFLAGLAKFAGFILSLPFAAVSVVLLSYILLVPEIFSSFRFASFIVGQFNIFLVLVCYLFYGFIVWRDFKKNKKPL